MNVIGTHIKIARLSANLTQSQLAEMSGVAEITIRQYEADKRQPRLEQLQKIVGVLGCSLDDLVNGENNVPLDTVGQRIKSARKKANMTQAELAEKAGTSLGTIQQYELEKRQPRLEQLQQIADALGCSLLFLINGEGEMTAEASAERIRELETELREARETIAELKAKLYDCMTAAETIRDLKAKLYDLTGEAQE